MANVRARIELRGSVSHQSKFRTCQRGKPWYSTNAAEIRYYKATGGFSVTMLAPEPRPKPVAAPRPEPTGVVEDDGDGLDEEDDDEGEEDESGPADSTLTQAQLLAQNKTALAELALATFNLELDTDKLSKAKMIAAIMKAQIAALEDDADDDDDDDDE